MVFEEEGAASRFAPALDRSAAWMSAAWILLPCFIQLPTLTTGCFRFAISKVEVFSQCGAQHLTRTLSSPAVVSIVSHTP